ncbi:MAG: hypothetical protein V2B18_18355 [Pseudomonadota bacterium]
MTRIIGILVTLSMVLMFGLGIGRGQQEVPSQLDRAKELLKIAEEESVRRLEKNTTQVQQSITNAENMLKSYETQIATLDEQIQKSGEQQKTFLKKQLEQVLGQKVAAEARLIGLKKELQAAVEQHRNEREELIGGYREKLNRLIKISCCLGDGKCSGMTEEECSAAGGKQVTDCAEDCTLYNCCTDGKCEAKSKTQCRAGGGTLVNYCRTECDRVNCVYGTDSSNPAGRCCRQTTRAACLETDGTVAECPEGAAPCNR